LKLSAGSRLVLAGSLWQVCELVPHTGRVLLRCDDGRSWPPRSGRWSTATTAGPSRPVARAGSDAELRPKEQDELEQLRATIEQIRALVSVPEPD